MNAIDRAGTFRGKILDKGVNTTKNGYPQFVVQLHALEYYDEQAGAYVPWAEYEQEITGYLVLYTKDKANGQWQELLNAKQIKAVLGWDGRDFEGLAGLNTEGKIVLFRVEENEYNGTTSLKVQWLDGADANPVKALPKFDTGKLRALTASLGGALSPTAAVPTPARAPSTKPAMPPKGKKTNPTKANSIAPGVTPPTPAVPKTAPVMSATSVSTPAVPNETKDSAWSACNSPMLAVTAEKLAEVWIAEATKIGKAEANFTSADWTTVKVAVMDQTAKF